MVRKTNSGLVIVTVLGVLALCGPARGVDGNDPISYWKFDEGEGTTAYDSVGDNDGTIYGAEWTTGQIGWALSFDGDDDYVEILHSDIGNPTGSFTISAWAKLTDTGSGGPYGDNDCIVSKHTWYKGYFIEYNWETSMGIRAGFGNGSGWHRIYGSLWDMGDWHFVVLRYDANASTLEFFDNAVSQGAISESSPQYSLRDLRIGSSEDASQEYQNFPGVIDEVAIYGRALSAEEIWQLYQDGLPHVNYVEIDIKPISCPNPLNVRSKGVLPIAILGTENFDVNSIDVTSIRLAGIAPIRSSYEDVATPVTDWNECECTTVGPDGYTDLSLKFKTHEIVEELIDRYDNLLAGEVLVLPLTGVLYDQTLIEGADCIVVVGKVRFQDR